MRSLPNIRTFFICFNNFSFSEPIWVGVEPNGISILDRLENKVVYLDYRLNYMSEVNLEPRLYPDLATIDKWGKMFIYSAQFHSIFYFEKRHLRKTPHIDLNRFSNIDFCKDVSTIIKGFASKNR